MNSPTCARIGCDQALHPHPEDETVWAGADGSVVCPAATPQSPAGMGHVAAWPVRVDGLLERAFGPPMLCRACASFCTLCALSGTVYPLP